MENLRCLWCQSDSNGKKYCCRQCGINWHNKNRVLTPNTLIKCSVCGREKQIWLPPSRKHDAEKNCKDYGKFCSRQCAGSMRTGNKHPRWKGGILIDRDGYRMVHSPNHPGSDKRGYIREHRLVMEEKIGRALKRSEVVHHIDDDPMNNDPSNLVLYPSNREHKRDDYKKRSTDSLGRLLPKTTNSQGDSR